MKINPKENIITKAVSISRFHIVFIAVGGSLVFGWLLTGRFHPALALLVAVDWFIVNVLNRVVDTKEDKINKINQTDTAFKYSRSIRIVSILLLAISFIPHLWWHPELALIRLIGHLLGFAYNFKLIPWFNGRKRLKELYFFKNIASATGFLITLFTYPLTIYKLRPEITPVYIFILMLFFAIFEISFEIIYDIRDINGDRKQNIKSFPVVHGYEFSASLVILLDIAAIYVLIAGAIFGITGLKENIMIFAPLSQLSYFYIAAKRGIRIFDCILITSAFALMLFIYCGWVLIGLPTSLPFYLKLTHIVYAGLIFCWVLIWLWMKNFYGKRNLAIYFTLISVSAWTAEQSSISLYQFYHYSKNWNIFIGSVPLAIILIWPMVILSTHNLLSMAGLKKWHLVSVSFFTVSAEAALMEVACVQAGLWSWTGSGIYGVPLIGMLGWGAFAAGAIYVMEYFKGVKLLLMPVAGLISTHIILQILWWGGMKYISYTTYPDAINLGVIGAISILTTVLSFKYRKSADISMGRVFPRIIAAQIIFYILFVSEPSLPVIEFCLCFVPPYLMLFRWRTDLKLRGVANNSQ